MADVVLKLERNKNQAMPSLTTIVRVRVPKGTRCIKFASSDNFYRETPAAEKDDGDADTDADQFLYLAGTYCEALVGDGSTDTPSPLLAADTFWYFVPTVVNQVIYLCATALG